MALNSTYLRKRGGRFANGANIIFPHRPFISKYTPFIIAIIANNRPFVRFYRNSGFTLVELIVTLTVAGILLMIAAPNMSRFIQNQRLVTQNNDLIADLKLARSESIKRATSVTVCKTLNPNATPPVCNGNDPDPWSTGRVIFVDIDGDATIDNGEFILRIRESIDGINSSGNRLMGSGASPGDTANAVTYATTGMTTLNAQSEIKSCDNRGPGSGRAIVISTTGRVRISAIGQDMNGGALVC